MRFRLLVASSMAALAVPATAGATTFCVGQPAGCSGVTLSASQLQSGALNSNALSDGQPDEIVLGAGTFTSTKNYTLGPGADPVELRGAGSDATVITSTSTSSGALLDFAGTWHPLTLRKLAVEVPATWLDGFSTQGLRLLHGAVLEDLRITSKNPKTDGMEVAGTTTLRRVTVDAFRGTAVRGGYNGADLTIEQSHLAGATAVGTSSGPNASTVDIRQSRLDAIGDAVAGAGLSGVHASSNIRSSLITLHTDGVTPVTGIFASGGSVLADHVTIARTTGPNEATTALKAVTYDNSTTLLKLANSIVTGVETVGQRSAPVAPNPGSANVQLYYTLLPTAFPAGTGTGTVKTIGGAVGSDPGFVDGPGGDLRLKPGSSAVDAGDPSLAYAPADLLGQLRVADGDGDGTPRTDMGAYERQPQPPAPESPAPAVPETPVAPAAPATADPVAPASTPTATTPPSVKTCTVPRLRGRTLKAARRALKAAGCATGRVTKGKGGKRVARQSVRAGARVPAGTKVALTLKKKA